MTEEIDTSARAKVTIKFVDMVPDALFHNVPKVARVFLVIVAGALVISSNSLRAFFMSPESCSYKQSNL